MSGCCNEGEYERVFAASEADSHVKRFRRKGLDQTETILAAAIIDRGVRGASVLEVGGGIGELQVALLEAGAARTCNVDLSPSWEAQATQLLDERQLADRARRMTGDFVALAPSLPSADVVLLHKVVCCYPDWNALVGAAVNKADRMLAMTLPKDVWSSHLAIWLSNASFALRQMSFRAFVHPVDSVIDLVAAAGLGKIVDESGMVWRTMVFARN